MCLHIIYIMCDIEKNCKYKQMNFRFYDEVITFPNISHGLYVLCLQFSKK